jgi:serine/threonine protein kinase
MSLQTDFYLRGNTMATATASHRPSRQDNKLKLGDLFDNRESRSWFRPVDTDAPGGFARAVEVKRLLTDSENEPALFKVMRHDLPNPDLARTHFLKELKLLAKIEKNRLSVDDDQGTILKPVTRVYDSGFVHIELPELLDRYRKPQPDMPVHQTGLDTEAFMEWMEKLDPSHWVPYIVVELANYNDSLFRQIQRRPAFDHEGLFRLPTAEVVYVAIRLLDTMKWLYENLDIAYGDWKPEHVYWNGQTRELKLIDWNVTWNLDKAPGRQQNIRDDIRLFCGAVLYCGLTLLDPEFGSNIGPRPTKDISNAVPELRRRYLTDNPQFYDAGKTLDPNIKAIIRRGLNPAEGFSDPIELQNELVNYLNEEFRLTPATIENGQGSDYLRAVNSLREAQERLGQAYGFVTDATRTLGRNPELNRLADIIRIAQERLP